jgi:hypothetical protein
VLDGSVSYIFKQEAVLMLPLELNYSGMVVQYSKDLLFNFKALSRLLLSDTAPKPLNFRRVHDTLFLRRDGKLEDGCIVEGGNVVVRTGGDKGLDFPWIPLIGRYRSAYHVA